MTFYEESKHKILVEEKMSPTNKRITMADVVTLINTLNDCTGNYYNTLFNEKMYHT